MQDSSCRMCDYLSRLLLETVSTSSYCIKKLLVLGWKGEGRALPSTSIVNAESSERGIICCIFPVRAREPACVLLLMQVRVGQPCTADRPDTVLMMAAAGSSCSLAQNQSFPMILKQQLGRLLGVFAAASFLISPCGRSGRHRTHSAFHTWLRQRHKQLIHTIVEDTPTFQKALRLVP